MRNFIYPFIYLRALHLAGARAREIPSRSSERSEPRAGESLNLSAKPA